MTRLYTPAVLIAMSASCAEVGSGMTAQSVNMQTLLSFSMKKKLDTV